MSYKSNNTVGGCSSSSSSNISASFLDLKAQLERSKTSSSASFPPQTSGFVFQAQILVGAGEHDRPSSSSSFLRQRNASHLTFLASTSTSAREGMKKDKKPRYFNDSPSQHQLWKEQKQQTAPFCRRKNLRLQSRPTWNAKRRFMPNLQPVNTQG